MKDPLKTNLHTHSTYCDGAFTPQRMVQRALELSFWSLGFSGHSMLECGKEWSMDAQSTQAYRKEITALQQQYRGQLDIFLGIEQDYYSTAGLDGYQYVIGSVHYLHGRDKEYFCPVDHSAQIMADDMAQQFCGDPFAYCKEFYRLEAQLAQNPQMQIAGHFDLVTKFNKDDCMFSTQDSRYRTPALEAMDALIDADKIFEINTSPIARGTGKMPYLQPFLLRHLAQRHGRVCINSDCHDIAYLNCGFSLAKELAMACGFRSAWVFNGSGFEEAAL